MRHRHRFRAAGDAFWTSDLARGQTLPAQTSTRLPAEAPLRADSDRGQRTWPVLTSLKSVLKHYLVQLCKALVFTEVGHTACVCMWLSTHPRVSATSVRGARECLTRRAKRRKAVLGLVLGAGSSRVRRGRTSSSEGPAVTCWLPHRRPLPSRSPFPSTRLCRLPPSWG